MFDAYMAYDWPFTVTLPGEPMPRRGRSYSESVAVLDLLSAMLRRSADTEDAKSFLDAAIAVVQWGGVRGNEARLLALGASALPVLGTAARQLDPTIADLDELDRVQDMNSGFSKIYSLLVDGFPIYDSRVACALASLVRLHCEEHGLPSVPRSLAFGIPVSRGSVKRDPSDETFRFPRIWPGHPRRYATSNVMAAWILDALSEEPPFGDLGTSRMLALESAMFMIGYAPVTHLHQG